ncbi:hypothetical protein [Mangrovibacter plantisponsor]|uniref:Uncharacterized protein n=1 Tax=Mangrovibacter plantisponsor TaxID=451513 RepID=A0A317Q8G0_9ENTR|nr:hypothetical protein [Mangrovibacter plantisponsor]PWW11812.1 hypothetical protein DES37_102427 [Mangrovibacter plantisponsor]
MNNAWRGNNKGRHQAVLIEYHFNPKEKNSKSVYQLRHSGQKTVLELNLTVERNNYGEFKPNIDFDDFPKGLSDREAMLKLADWLHRLSVVIEDNWVTQ